MWLVLATVVQPQPSQHNADHGQTRPSRNGALSTDCQPHLSKHPRTNPSKQLVLPVPADLPQTMRAQCARAMPSGTIQALPSKG